jgi:hypothetical protein
VAALGPGRGLVLTAVLFALVRASFGLGDAYRALTLGAQALLDGLLLGGLRLVSGSILPGIALAMLVASAGFAAVAARGWLPIPGFNAGGDHTPLAWLAPAALSVALGVATLIKASRRR